MTTRSGLIPTRAVIWLALSVVILVGALLVSTVALGIPAPWADQARRLPASEADLRATLIARGPDELLRLFEIRSTQRLTNCLRGADVREQRGCEIQQEAYLAQWRTWLNELLAMVDAEPNTMAAVSRPASSCLIDAGIPVSEDELSSIFPTRGALINLVAEATAANVTSTARAELASRLVAAAHEANSLTNVSGGSTAPTVVDQVQHLIDAVAIMASTAEADPASLDHQRWAGAAFEASSLAEKSFGQYRAILIQFSDAVHLRLSMYQDDVARGYSQSDELASDLVASAIVECGDYGKKPEPTVDDLQAWLLSHPEVVDELIEKG